MKYLVVIAHPQSTSLCHALATDVIATLHSAGHEVVIENLYERSFDPRLTQTERDSYYTHPFDQKAIQGECERLSNADGIVLLFPTWWFGLPAILKGWFDRVWAPGVAFNHSAQFGPITANLTQLKRVLVVTSLGSPWWVDRLIMRRPVRKQLKYALLKVCAPQARFEMTSVYKSEQINTERFQRIVKHIQQKLTSW